MKLRDWLKSWIIAVLTCIVVLTGCGVTLLWQHYSERDAFDSRAVINQVRLQVNDMMLYLSKYHSEVDTEWERQETLKNMSEEKKMDLQFADLKGNVMFNSSQGNDSLQKIDISTDLHYDLYQARLNEQEYRIAFPVVDEETKAQIGNAIFTLPASLVLIQNADFVPPAIFFIMMVLILLLVLFLNVLVRKMKRDVIRPIHQLKEYSEAILKGNYEQQNTYKDMDEIGEVFAMLDQMRMEIVHHSMRRDEQEQAQKELVSNISHELKTPLTTLNAYIEVIREGSCTNMQEVMEYVEVMHNSTEKMTRLTEDLLMHALKELGQISVTLTEQYSKEVFSNILQPISHYVRTTGVQFVEPEHIPNVLIHMDAHRMEQVISNLIANSLKHTKAGDTISVDLQLDQGQLQITIADTGEGILPQDMPFVFERYFKGKSNARRRGTGLGLSICKHIVEAHHGSISFKSIRGQGTVFYCALPLG